ncbi:MAG: Holliday junction resolvase RuvX [Nitrospira sp.]|nr:Holliday junction resolvase RuvX [Nitrospira sp.]
MSGKRILALDPGTKRIGVALSDELGWTAQPLETYERKTLPADLAHIKDLITRHEVKAVVVGLPVRLDGQIGLAAQQVQEFIKRLQEVIDLPIIAWDERLTTRSAEELLIAADVSRKKRKGVVDRVAAALLLKSYLEHLSAPTPGEDLPPDADR